MTSLPVAIEFECRDLPASDPGQWPNLRLGIQKGKEVEDDVATSAGVAHFRFTLQARQDAGTGQPVFTGPYSQGTPADRFVYLCWGERDGGQFNMSMRVKVPLRDLTWNQVQAAASRGQPIRAVLRLTDAAGKPITATIKSPHIEWEQA
jgi:hypothetical protein